MRTGWLKLAAVPITSVFLAAACGSSKDSSGGATATTASGTTTVAASTTTASGATTTTAAGTGATTTLPPTPGKGSAGKVTVFGVEDSENEAGAMQDALTAFGTANGIDITYVGRRDFEQQINAQVLADNPPDIGAFPQPGKLKQFAADGKLKKVPDDVVSAVKGGWADSYLAFSNVDGTQYGVPFKSDLKSLVWYVPSVWQQKGYKVPTTLAEFNTLVDTMIKNGDTPLCVGIESGAATGWPFTDWVEELVLREKGIDYYNQWVDHKVPFNDQPVIDAFNQVAGPDGYWKKSGAVFSSGGSIAATAFGDNGAPLVEGKCMMHRQASFFSAFFPQGTAFGEGAGQVSTFYFPADSGHPVLVGGISAGAFRDAARGMEGDAVPRFGRLRRCPSGGAEQASWRRPLGVPHRELEGRHDEMGTPRAGLHQAAPDGQSGGVRRLRPDASRSRVWHLLDRGDVVRQRRRGRQVGRLQRPGVVAQQLTD